MGKIRGHHEGSLYQRKNGLWVASVSIQGKRLYKYAKTLHEARSWLEQTRDQINSGLTFAAAQISLDKFLQDWLGACQASIRPKTLQQYAQIVNQYLSPGLGSVRLKDLRPDHIQSLYNALLRNGKSERTVLLIHSVLHGALNQALRWGLIGRNPAQAVMRPKLKRQEMKTLSDVQAKSLLNTAKGSRLDALLWLALTTGLREGEILGLKWSDLDWTAKRLKIQRQLQRLRDKGLVFTEPKSMASRRAVTLSSDIISRLRSQRVVQAYEKLFAGDRWQEHDLIFPSTLGTPLDPRNLYRQFKNALKEARLPNIRFHDLRHTAATLMLQQHTHPKVVQERLGHSDISLTLNTYSHVLPDIQEEAAEKMTQALMPIEATFRKENSMPFAEETNQFSEKNQIHANELL
jgi:integrase